MLALKGEMLTHQNLFTSCKHRYFIHNQYRSITSLQLGPFGLELPLPLLAILPETSVLFPAVFDNVSDGYTVQWEQGQCDSYRCQK